METDLKLAAVAQITIMDAQNLVDELERLRMAYAKQLGALSLILKAFGDLYSELTDKTSDRKWLSNQIIKAEREADRQRIPAWFWRLDQELPLNDQLYRRARWLLEEKPDIHLDDLWDCLIDAITYSKVSVESNDLQRIVEGAIHGGSK
jgi:hypothetical protein